MSTQPYRLMIVANRTGPCPGLEDVVDDVLDGRPGTLHVVAPTQASRVQWMFDDVDQAATAAHDRLQIAVEQLRAAGLPTSGEVGDCNPLRAIEDALTTFAADAVLISRARNRLGIRVHHVVSDFGAAPRDTATAERPTHFAT